MNLVAVNRHRVRHVAEVVAFHTLTSGGRAAVVEFAPVEGDREAAWRGPEVDLVPLDELLAYMPGADRVTMPADPLVELAYEARRAAALLSAVSHMLVRRESADSVRSVRAQAARLAHAAESVADVTEVLAPWDRVGR